MPTKLLKSQICYLFSFIIRLNRSNRSVTLALLVYFRFRNSFFEISCYRDTWHVRILFENISLGVSHDTRQLLSPSRIIWMFACFFPGKGREKEKMCSPGTPLISGKLCVRKLIFNTSKSWRNIAFFGDIKCNWLLRMPFLGLPPIKNLWYFSFISFICVGFGYRLMVSWPFLLSLLNVITLEFDKVLYAEDEPPFLQFSATACLTC